MQNLLVYVGNDPDNLEICAEYTGPSGTKVNVTIPCDLPGPKMGQYIKVVKNDTDMLSFCEFEAYEYDGQGRL